MQRITMEAIKTRVDNLNKCSKGNYYVSFSNDGRDCFLYDAHYCIISGTKREMQKILFSMIVAIDNYKNNI